jgi:hypothetical protein
MPGKKASRTVKFERKRHLLVARPVGKVAPLQTTTVERVRRGLRRSVGRRAAGENVSGSPTEIRGASGWRRTNV